MTISKELLDELLSGVERPEDLLGDKGLMKELKVRLMERMLGAELTEHLGYEPHGEPANSMQPATNSLSYTPNGSINDPFQPHGPNPIHRVSDTPAPRT